LLPLCFNLVAAHLKRIKSLKNKSQSQWRSVESRSNTYSVV
jgi:hypothetical protein